MNTFSDTSPIYDIPLTTIDGADTTLGDYKGKILLIVNLASRCGFTPQYEGLENLQQKYGPMGLTICGFPSNDFLFQEPGCDEEIHQFAKTRFNISFPMYSKISVWGRNIHPLYRWLTSHSEHGGLVKWNFTKFLINRDGDIVDRFHTFVDPESDQLTSAIEKLL